MFGFPGDVSNVFFNQFVNVALVAFDAILIHGFVAYVLVMIGANGFFNIRHAKAILPAQMAKASATIHMLGEL